MEFLNKLSYFIDSSAHLIIDKNIRLEQNYQFDLGFIDDFDIIEGMNELKTGCLFDEIISFIIKSILSDKNIDRQLVTTIKDNKDLVNLILDFENKNILISHNLAFDLMIKNKYFYDYTFFSNIETNYNYIKVGTNIIQKYSELEQLDKIIILDKIRINFKYDKNFKFNFCVDNPIIIHTPKDKNSTSYREFLKWKRNKTINNI
jgi:hypothetical protein